MADIATDDVQWLRDHLNELVMDAYADGQHGGDVNMERMARYRRLLSAIARLDAKPADEMVERVARQALDWDTRRCDRLVADIKAGRSTAYMRERWVCAIAGARAMAAAMSAGEEG